MYDVVCPPLIYVFRLLPPLTGFSLNGDGRSNLVKCIAFVRVSSIPRFLSVDRASDLRYCACVDEELIELRRQEIYVLMQTPFRYEISQ